MAAESKTPSCPTALFGQLELALRENDFAEAGRLRDQLRHLGVTVHFSAWPDSDPTADEGVSVGATS